MNLRKYENCEEWLAPVKAYDRTLASAVTHIHLAICLADDIGDRAVMPDKASHCLWEAMKTINAFVHNPKAWALLYPVINRIYEAEQRNLTFIPGRDDVEEEIETWFTRASLLDLYFEAACCVDQSLDTKGNRKWFWDFKFYCLAADDCQDLIQGTFEDLRQCRRNIVILRKYGHDGYFGWEKRKDEIKKKAEEFLEGLAVKPPKDKRLEYFMRG